MNTKIEIIRTDDDADLLVRSSIITEPDDKFEYVVMDDNIKEKSKINLNKKLDLKLNLQNINDSIPTERKKPNTDRDIYNKKPKSPSNDIMKNAYLSSNRNKMKSPVFSTTASTKFTKEVFGSTYLSSLTPRDFVVKKTTKNLDRLYSAQKLYTSKPKTQLKMGQTRQDQPHAGLPLDALAQPHNSHEYASL